MKHSGTPFRSVLALGVLGVVASVCVSLGLWQLDRAAQREALLAAIEQGRRQPPVALTPASRSADLTPWRPAVAEGRWAKEKSVLLENRNLDGRPGYWLASPLLLAPAYTHAVLVLRGWLPRDMGAAGKAPALPDEPGNVQVRGELLAHVPRIFELWQWAGGKASQLPATLPGPDGAVPVVQNLELRAYAQSSGLQLLPAVLAQTASTEGTPASGAAGSAELRRDWPGPSADSDQNRGYALQWFSFAGIALVAAGFVAGNLLRRRSARRPHQRTLKL